MDDLTKKIADIEKMNKIIMDKNKDGVGYGIDGEELEKKMDMVKILPWAAFNVNLFIQLLSIIMDCILMGRINLKSHFGFPKETNTSILKKPNTIVIALITDQRPIKSAASPHWLPRRIRVNSFRYT